MRYFFGLKTAVLIATGLMFAATGAVRSAEKQGLTAKDAFARLKGLAGEWKAKIDGFPGHNAEGKVSYKLTGAGSALVETDFPGASHEMVSVFHLDGKDLRMTHYCAAGNQPRMKLDPGASTSDRYVFVFDGGTNLDADKDMHIHGLIMNFDKDGKVTSEWEAFMGGKKAGTTTFEMSRP